MSGRARCPASQAIDGVSRDVQPGSLTSGVCMYVGVTGGGDIHWRLAPGTDGLSGHIHWRLVPGTVGLSGHIHWRLVPGTDRISGHIHSVTPPSDAMSVDPQY